MKTYQLVAFGDASKAFRLTDAPDPAFGETDVLIEVACFGLNFADVMARRGMYKDAPPKPCVLGYEVAGMVKQTGTAVTNVKPGDRVAAFTRFGGYATLAVAPAQAVVPLPADVSLHQGLALATQYSTAWFAAEEMVRVHAGDHVMVNAAAGGVGIALLQLLKRRKAVIYANVGSQAKADFLKKEIGPDHIINYSNTNYEQEIRLLIKDRGLDVAFDSLGGEHFARCYRLLGHGGRVVGYGAADRTGSLLDTLKLAAKFGIYSPIQLMMGSRALIGVNMLRIADHRPEALRRSFESVVELAARGELKPYIGEVYKAAQLADAHSALENRGTIGKVVVDWD